MRGAIDGDGSGVGRLPEPAPTGSAAVNATAAPPHSAEAEQAVLGALMMDGSALDTVAHLAPEHFFFHHHGTIFAALREQVAKKGIVDLVELHDELRRAGKADELGGLPYLDQLSRCVWTTLGLVRHADIVIGHAMRRQALAALDRARQMVLSEDSAAEALARTQRTLEEVASAGGYRPPPAVKPVRLNLRAMAHEKAPPRSWFVREWLGPGPMLFAAAGGIGKSLLQQQTATALAIGRAYIGEVDEPCRSLVWGCEDDADEMWRRQEAISGHFGIPLDAPGDMLTLESRRGVDNLLMAPLNGELRRTRVFDELREQVNDLKADILWLDNVAHLFGGDEVNRGQVTAFINAMAGLVVGRPLAVVLLAHTARQVGSEFAGSAAWENACRMRWYLGTKLPDQKPSSGDDDEGADDVRYLAKRKSNYSARDYLRFTMHHGVLVPDVPDAAAGPNGLLSPMTEQRAEEILLEGFATLRAMGINGTDGRSSPDFLPRQIVSKRLGRGFSEHDLTKAMNRLMGKGMLLRGVVGKYSNGKGRPGLVLAEETAGALQ